MSKKTIILQAQGKVDFTVEAFEVDVYGEKKMAIGATEECIYLTKQQACEFFNLVPAEQVGGQKVMPDDEETAHLHERIVTLPSGQQVELGPIDLDRLKEHCSGVKESMKDPDEKLKDYLDTISFEQKCLILVKLHRPIYGHHVPLPVLTLLNVLERFGHSQATMEELTLAVKNIKEANLVDDSHFILQVITNIDLSIDIMTHTLASLYRSRAISTAQLDAMCNKPIVNPLAFSFSERVVAAIVTDSMEYLAKL